jgi:hypothetical protein
MRYSSLNLRLQNGQRGSRNDTTVRDRDRGAAALRRFPATRALPTAREPDLLHVSGGTSRPVEVELPREPFVFAAGERAWRWPIVLGRLAGTLLEGAKRLSHCRTPATQANHSWTRVEWIRLFAIDLAYAAPTTGYTVTIKRITVQPIARGKRQFCVIAQIENLRAAVALPQRPVPLVDCPAARLRRAWDRRETTGGPDPPFPAAGETIYQPAPQLCR